MNFHLLHPVAIDTLRGMDDDFLNKLVDHGRGQLRKIGILPCQLQKLLHTGTVLCESGQPFFRFCDRNLQRFLLGFVIRQQTVKAFIGDASDSKGFIELFDDGVQLGNALFVLAQLSLGIFGRFRLPELGGRAHLFHKRRLIGNCEGADRADGVQNQGTQGLGRDVMAAAGGSSFLAGEGIGGTIEEIRGIGIILRAAFGAVVIHLCSTVSTEHKPCQGIRLTQRVDALGRLAELLGKLPCFSVHNGLVGIFKDQPILLGIHYGVFIFIGLLVGAKIHRMPHILRLGEDLSHDIAAPVIGIGKFLFAFPDTLALLTEVHSRRFHLILKENTGNIVGPFALDGQSENAPHHGGSFLVDQPMVFVLRVFLVTVNGTVGGGLAGLSLDADGGFLLAAQVAQIPLVHDVEEGGKFIAVLVIAVHAVGDGNKVNAVLPEEYLRVKSGLQIVTPRPAHILDNDMGYLPGLDVCNQLFPSWAFKIAAAPAVVGIVTAVGVAPLLGIAFEVFFLIHDGIAIPGVVIVAGQPLIESGNFAFSLFHAHDALLSDCRLICGVSIIP